jgi:hypothetical protein
MSAAPAFAPAPRGSDGPTRPGSRQRRTNGTVLRTVGKEPCAGGQHLTDRAVHCRRRRSGAPACGPDGFLGALEITLMKNVGQTSEVSTSSTMPRHEVEERSAIISRASVLAERIEQGAADPPRSPKG